MRYDTKNKMAQLDLRSALLCWIVAGLIGSIIWIIAPDYSTANPHRISPDAINWADEDPEADPLDFDRMGQLHPLRDQFTKKSTTVRRYSFEFLPTQFSDQHQAIVVPAIGGQARLFLNGVDVAGTKETALTGIGLNSRQIIYDVELGDPADSAMKVEIYAYGDRINFGLREVYLGAEDSIQNLAQYQSMWAVTGIGLTLTCGLILFFLIMSVVAKFERRKSLYATCFVASSLFCLAIAKLPVVGLFMGKYIDGAEVILCILGIAALAYLGESDHARAGLKWLGKKGMYALPLLAIFTVIITPDHMSTGVKLLPLIFLSPLLVVIIVDTLEFPKKTIAAILLKAAAIIVTITFCVQMWVLGRLNDIDLNYNFASLTLFGGIPFLALQIQNVFSAYSVVSKQQSANMALLLRQKQQELDEMANRLEQESRQRVLMEERERLGRDMHDGIGGQLLSLLVRVQSGKLGQQGIEQELLGSINDLRLIVDSLDHTGDNLADALATFRMRARQQVEAAQVEFIWREADGLLSAISLEPGKILNLYRFMQEAVTNALRHAQARRIEIAFDYRVSENNLIISISDDGKGMGASLENMSGKGLRNMKKRAHILGGEIDFQKGLDSKGVRIELTLPQMQSAHESD